MLLRVALALCLLLAAGGFGTVALIASRPASDPVLAAPAPPPPVQAALLVAARSLPAGTLVKDEDFALRLVAPEAVPEGALVQSEEVRAELRGALLRRYLEAGTPVARTDVLRPRDRGFLAAVLRPGTRAIAVGVDAVTGAAGLIWPGDQVDVILTQELDASAAPIARRVVGETVLTSIRVIAVDQEFTQGATVGAVGAGGNGQRAVARTITLEVLPEHAERVAVAGRLGRLSLTIRAMDQAPEGAAPDATASDALPSSVFGSDVSPALSRSGPAVGSRIRVIQGNDLQEVVFR
ncbi:Flp pilus assembly protein CpaB [Siccirubricoccus sp. G192]|uniref:Flp pilus assembly protein CpaB n=1 Tax=Siccirubricoccus sp. G192 TaxID=2849651 RepID=UPI001C2BAD03|nr:Flp pilus assembly protein CpaB [Siccirubricoccus sp. G192]MBV1798606.1 Flp pilus assembly protein CpaB [Siccirubricoccus sp. G192]